MTDDLARVRRIALGVVRTYMTVMVAFFAAYIAVYSITDPSERSVWTDLASVVLLVVMVWVIVAMMEWEYSLHVQRERKHLRDLVPVREG